MCLFVLIFVSLIGILLLYGAYKQWQWLINPPSEWAWFYSQSFLKKIIGKKGLLIYTYFIGFLLLVIGIAGIAYFSFGLNK